MTAIGTSSAIATTTSAARATRKPSAPPPLPSRRLAPETRSLITRQAATAPTQGEHARRAAPSSRKPAIRPITAARMVIRPRAEPWVPVVPASMPIAMPIPSSVRTSTCENLTARALAVSIRHTSVHERSAASRRTDAAPTPAPATSSATPACSPQRTKVMRSSAMRDLMAITARPEVISLAGGLPDTSTFPPAELRRADDPDRPGVGGRGAPVRADRGLRGDQGLHPRGDGARRGCCPTPRT